MVQEKKKETSPEDVHFGIFLSDKLRTFDSLKLTPYKEATAVINRRPVRAAIIGESHYVEIHRPGGKMVFAETLACVDFEEVGFKPSIDHKIERGMGFFSENFDLSYGIRVMPASATRLTIHADKKREAKGIVLRNTFDGLVGPRTKIAVLPYRRGGIEILTLHEYAVVGFEAFGLLETILTRTVIHDWRYFA